VILTATTDAAVAKTTISKTRQLWFLVLYIGTLNKKVNLF